MNNLDQHVQRSFIVVFSILIFFIILQIRFAKKVNAYTQFIPFEILNNGQVDLDVSGKVFMIADDGGQLVDNSSSRVLGAKSNHNELDVLLKFGSQSKDGFIVKYRSSRKFTLDDLGFDKEDEVVYEINITPVNGKVVNSEGEVLTTFTNQQIVNEKVYYEHIGDDVYSDFLTLTVLDKKSEATETIQINILIEKENLSSDVNSQNRETNLRETNDEGAKKNERVEVEKIDIDNKAEKKNIDEASDFKRLNVTSEVKGVSIVKDGQIYMEQNEYVKQSPRIYVSRKIETKIPFRSN